MERKVFSCYDQQDIPWFLKLAKGSVQLNRIRCIFQEQT